MGMNSMGSSHLLSQLLDAIPQTRRLLKIQLLSSLLHLAFQLIDQLRQRLLHQAGIGTVLLQLPRQLQEAEDRVAGLLARRLGTTPCFSL